MDVASALLRPYLSAAALSRKGSGIGVKNVNERIRLYFGEEYGITIWSEPDEGTVIHIHLPAQAYTEMTQEGDSNK